MLSKIIRIKTKPMPSKEETKSVKIKITQKDVDDLNKRIRKDIEEIEKRRITGYEIAEKTIMK